MRHFDGAFQTEAVNGIAAEERDTSENTLIANAVRAHELPGQSNFNRLTPDQKRKSWQIFNHVMWATYKNATEEDITFAGWQHKKTQETRSFQKIKMENWKNLLDSLMFLFTLKTAFL